jgi:Ca2+-binding EF-hand superfamily protein
MVQALKVFGSFTRFKRMMMGMMSLTMNPDQVKAMRDAFERIDGDNTGVLSLAEFKTALRNFEDISNETARP